MATNTPMAAGQHLTSVCHLLCHEHQSAELYPRQEQQLFGIQITSILGKCPFHRGTLDWKMPEDNKHTIKRHRDV